MKRLFPLLLALLALAASAALQQSSGPPPPSSTLRWLNGETLAGELVEATETELTWKSPFFLDPLRIKADALYHVVQPQASHEPADPYSVVLKDGSHLYGELAGVTADAVTIRSTRHGELTLRRAEVLRVRRWKGRSLVSAGPLGDVGWKILAADEKTRGRMPVFGDGSRPSGAPPERPPLTAGAGGTLPLLSWNLAAYRDVQLPKLVEVDFRVTATARPDFELALESGQNDQLHIETWNDDLVVASGWDFQRIRKVEAAERAVPLRVFWDREKQKFWVYDIAGKLLAEWSVFGDPQSPPPKLVAGTKHRLSLRNKGRDLTLDALTIREWNGTKPAALDLGKPRLELATGRMIEGEIRGTGGDKLHVTMPGQETPEEIPLADVDAVDFAPRISPKANDGPTLTFDDGTLLIGRVLGVRDGAATIALAGAEKPVSVKLNGLRQWLLKRGVADEKAEPPAPSGDQLVSGKTTLHGQVVGTGEHDLRWLPTGGVAPVRLASVESVKITRVAEADAAGSNISALVYTRTGEVIPCALRAINAAGAEIENSIVSAKSIPLANLAAVQFGILANRKLTNFTDPEWRIVKGDPAALKRGAASIQLSEGTSLAHPSALLSREFQVNMWNDGFGAARVRLFCNGSDPAGAMNILIAQMSDRLTTGLETQEGQMNQQQQGRIEQGRGNNNARTGNEFRFVIGEKQVELFVDGALWQTFPSDAANRGGSGLIIEPASVWGNSVRPISLAKFSAASAPGAIAPPSVQPEAKLQALTVPRFRKEQPPKHALIGLNGDVLRGEIEAMTSTHFGFRVGLETLRVPRDGVKAVIWLQPPSDTPAAAEAPSEEDKLPELKQALRLRAEMPSVTVLSCLSMLRRQFPDITFVVPPTREKRRVQFSIQGQTLKQAIEQLCTTAEMSFKVEPGKRIVFIAGAGAEHAFAKKVYWLPATAFADPAAVREALAAKGVEFPEGSSVAWDPGTGQLNVLNSAANQAKLATVLREQFGDTVAAPTHWLQLTSGARFGLAVQKFERELIRGTHPLYGEIKVPLAQVYTIDSSAPAQSGALKELSTWRLVLAREPVLPETGGESSPALGKEAKAFTVPLVGGGEFDLEKAKGKVVVLDFWATWCGPCIRSLPELITAMAAFPAERVEFIGINEGEAEGHVKKFLETRGWKLRTGLDASQSVGRSFGVEGIPHTVVIGPDGKVAWVKTGYSPTGAQELSEAVKRLLEAK